MDENRTGIHIGNLSRYLASDIEVEWPDSVPLTVADFAPAQVARKVGDGYSFDVPHDFVQGSVHPEPRFTDLGSTTDSGKRRFRLDSINLKPISVIG